MERLLEVIQNFKNWQQVNYPDRHPEEIGGEWEVDFPDWDEAYDAFYHVLVEQNARTADKHLLDEMIYLIARDNEAEWLISDTVQFPVWFEVLCRHCLETQENDAKWQFAAHLHESMCGQNANDLILLFAEDANEYVCRRALLAMPKLCPDQVEKYAVCFWERDRYSQKQEEYQRMAALSALADIKSPLLLKYLTLAKQDDRVYLSQYAEKIEKELGL